MLHHRTRANFPSQSVRTFPSALEIVLIHEHAVSRPSASVIDSLFFHRKCDILILLITTQHFALSSTPIHLDFTLSANPTLR